MENIPDLSWKWIIKDNGSVDNSIEMINSWENPNVIPIKYPHNRDNFSEGCNFCFKEAACKDDDFVMLLNNDIVFQDIHSIKNMLSIFRDPDVGLVGAKTLFKDSKMIQHAGVIFHNRNRMPFHFGANEKDSDKFAKNREFQAVTGACWLTKAEYFKNICTTNKSGNVGLSEQYIWAFDDIDGSLSIKYNLGKKIVCCANTKILHDESSSLQKNPMNKLFMNLNIKTLLNTWRGRYILDADTYSNTPKYNTYIYKS